ESQAEPRPEPHAESQAEPLTQLEIRYRLTPRPCIPARAMADDASTAAPPRVTRAPTVSSTPATPSPTAASPRQRPGRAPQPNIRAALPTSGAENRTSPHFSTVDVGVCPKIRPFAVPAYG